MQLAWVEKRHLLHDMPSFDIAVLKKQMRIRCPITDEHAKIKTVDAELEIKVITKYFKLSMNEIKPNVVGKGGCTIWQNAY